MIKSFGQWNVVSDGIETNRYFTTYHWISKKDIMNRNTDSARNTLECPGVNKDSLIKAFKYAHKYFHAVKPSYSVKSDPEIYKEMLDEFETVRWVTSVAGNFTVLVDEGFNITVYKNKKGRWTWVFADIYSKNAYKNIDAAKKKAFASYYWVYRHLLNRKKV
ncbi:MAG: hypothetical protein ACYC54_04655 [Sedimentisphaerales bacterium]